MISITIIKAMTIGYIRQSWLYFVEYSRQNQILYTRPFFRSGAAGSSSLG